MRSSYKNARSPAIEHDRKASPDERIRVLFVCLGNICRSPLAEAVTRGLIERNGLGTRVEVASAGTGDYHNGEGADRRALLIARERGIDLRGHRARQVTISDLRRYDYVLAMDRENYDDLVAMCPDGYEHRLGMFLAFAPHLDMDEVPDPYYGGEAGFERVCTMIEEAADGLLAELRARLGTPARCERP